MDINKLSEEFDKEGFLIFEEPNTKKLASDLEKAIIDVMLERSKSLDVNVNKDGNIDEIYQKLYDYDPKITGGIYKQSIT